MSLTIHRPGKEPVKGLVADRELCLDRNQQHLVEAGSVESAWVLAGKGHVIPAAEVERLDLRMWSDGRVMQGAEPVLTVSEPPEVWADAMPEPKKAKAPKKSKE